MYFAAGLVCLMVKKVKTILIPVAIGTTKHEEALRIPIIIFKKAN